MNKNTTEQSRILNTGESAKHKNVSVPWLFHRSVIDTTAACARGKFQWHHLFEQSSILMSFSESITPTGIHDQHHGIQKNRDIKAILCCIATETRQIHIQRTVDAP